MKKKIVLFGLVVAVCVAIVSFAIASGLRTDDKGSKKEDTTAVSSKNSDGAYFNKAATLADIKKNDGGVNIYMFWGDGCPHCKAQWEYLESIKDEYPYINVYGFEVWYEKDNLALLKTFAAAMGDDEVSSVPYTIIGEEKLNGFNSEKLLEMIKKAKESKFDVYFDKVKYTL